LTFDNTTKIADERKIWLKELELEYEIGIFDAFLKMKIGGKRIEWAKNNG
jgi:hypothetical protein